MNEKLKVKIPPNSKFLADFNNLSESKRKELVEAMFELASKDVTESKNLGFVTFSDILGWKGIWRDKDRNPLRDILKIKRDLEEFIQKTYKEHLIQCFQLVTGEKLVEKFQNSIIVISYKYGGAPSIELLTEILQRYKQNIRIHDKHYKYALNKQNGDATLNREYILIGY